MATLSDMITEAERAYDKVAEESGFQADYTLGRLRGLQDAAKCDRLTPAEQAVIEAALAMTGSRSPRLAMALGELRKERDLPARVRYEAPAGERKVLGEDK